MHTRILIRITTVFVFVFTCCLTSNVVANERGIAPLLSPDAWKLLADAEALCNGFIPTKVISIGLKPRPRAVKPELVKRPHSRIMVKFIDTLQIRLDPNKSPYSRTNEGADSITSVCDSLGITLEPIVDHTARLDALIRKAELASHKQQPDIGGMYWINGDDTSVEVAAELFHTLDEVEWVVYTPVFSKAPRPSNRNNATQRVKKKKAKVVERFGACQFTFNLCDADLSQSECLDLGGTFLGEGSICDPVVPIYEQEYRLLGTQTGACCVSGAPPTCMTVTLPVCVAAGGTYLGNNSPCPDDPCDGGSGLQGACCTGVDGATCSDEISENACATLGGTYAGEGTDCVSLPCSDGACCFETDCFAGITKVDCENDSGTYGGGGSTCDPNLCGDGVGACCILYEFGQTRLLICELKNEADCVDADGEYHGRDINTGAGISCATMPCTGACCFGTNCLLLVRPIDCTNAGGTYSGDLVIDCDDCDAPPAGGDGQCCIPIGCVRVADEAECLAIYNGIYIGPFEGDPLEEEPCENATECPSVLEGGVPFEDYDQCAEEGEPASYLTGDCYIDQTSLFQTNRVSAISPYVPDPLADPEDPLEGVDFDFPVGCLDTQVLLGGPEDTDLVVLTGLPTGAVTNIIAGSTCCETVIANQPQCGTGSWDAICAAEAISLAILDQGCGRDIPEPLPGTTSSIYPPLGDLLILELVQPQLDTDNVTNFGDGLVISFQNTLGIQTATVTIESTSVVPVVGCVLGCNLLLTTSTGGVETTGTIPFSSTFNSTLTAIKTQVESMSFLGGNPWTATITGDGTTASTLLHINQEITVYDASLDEPIIPQSLSCVNISNSGGLGPFGPPTLARTSTTPDYASLGLLTWMTDETMPFQNSNGEQLLALPSYTETLTGTDLEHIYQLLPWPMGGSVLAAGGGTPSTFSPPLSGKLDEQGNPIVGLGSTGWWGGDGGVNLFPDAPNPDGFGGQSIYKGAYGLGQLWVDEGVGLINGAFGNNVKVAVLDWSAYLTERTNEQGLNVGGIHEEFLKPDGTLKVLLEGPNTTGHTWPGGALQPQLNYDDSFEFGRHADHGTAVLGVIGANWNPAAVPGDSIETRLLNNVGVLGMAPDADLYFFPLSTVDDPDRRPQAWLNAIETLGPGDIICAAYREPLEFGGPLAGEDDIVPNLNYDPTVTQFMEIANNLGICTVIRSGDAGTNLPALEEEDDNFVMVGTSCTPGADRLPVATRPNYKRYADGQRSSNFFQGAVQDYSVVTASGWGSGVITCGMGPLGDNYIGFNTIVYSNPTDAHAVHAQSYTNKFGFSDAGAAQLAGAAAIVQGFTKQVFDIPLGPRICRQMLAGGVFVGIDKEGTSIVATGPITIQHSMNFDCELPVPDPMDFDKCIDAGNGNLVGNRIDPRKAMQNVITNPIFSTENIENAFFIRGNHFVGNTYSIAAVDNNLLGATPVRVNAHVPYSVPSGVPGGVVHYLGNGATTDLYVTGNLSGSFPVGNSFVVIARYSDIQQGSLIVQLEMLDRRTGKWEQAAASATVLQGTNVVPFVVDSATQYINPSTYKYHLRIVTLDINAPNGGPTAIFPVSYDQVFITSLYVPSP